MLSPNAMIKKKQMLSPNDVGMGGGGPETDEFLKCALLLPVGVIMPCFCGVFGLDGVSLFLVVLYA